MSYLDVARSLVAGDFRETVNGYWSPLYSWLLAIGLLITGASPSEHFAVAHGVNFAIFVGTFIAFEFLLRECFAFTDNKENFPLRWFVAAAYVTFAAATLAWIRVHNVTPDLAVAAWVILAGGLTLRVVRSGGSKRSAIALGVVLGLAYLTKAALLPLSAAFVAPAVLFANKRIRTLALIAVPLLCVAAPYIFALSLRKGRPTAGDVAKLNYAWYVGEVRVFKHWRGEERATGVPAHPTRKLVDRPATYEFREPVQGTYPVWYDPSFWHEGLEVKPHWHNQWKRLARETWQVGWMFGRMIWAFAGIAIMLALHTLRIDRKRALVACAPLIAAIVMYSLVHVERRFLAGFLIVSVTGVLASIRVMTLPTTRVLQGLMILLILALLYDVADEGVDVVERLESAPAGNHYAHTANALRATGVDRGETIALIGDGFRAYWAYVGGYHIGAEVSPREFWSVPRNLRQASVAAMFSNGISAVIADRKAGCPEEEGWRRVPHTTLCHLAGDKQAGPR